MEPFLGNGRSEGQQSLESLSHTDERRSVDVSQSEILLWMLATRVPLERERLVLVHDRREKSDRCAIDHVRAADALRRRNKIQLAVSFACCHAPDRNRFDLVLLGTRKNKTSVRASPCRGAWRTKRFLPRQ